MNGRDWQEFWEFDSEHLVLVCNRGGYGYEIDLERIRDSATALDWIAQIANKRWGTSEVVGALVLALNELLGLQQHFCGFGQNRQVSNKRLRQIIKEREA